MLAEQGGQLLDLLASVEIPDGAPRPDSDSALSASRRAADSEADVR